MTRHTAVSMLGAAALLAACGGGGGGSTDDPFLTVPPSALAAPEAFTQYVAAQAEDERREPTSMEGIVPPTSETAEPLPVTR